MKRPVAAADDQRVSLVGGSTLHEAASKVLRIYDGLADDENDGEFALWAENDLHAAILELRRAL